MAMILPLRPHSHSASNVTNLEDYNEENSGLFLGFQHPFAEAEDRESSNSTIIKVKLSKESRKILKTKRAFYKNGMKRVESDQNQEEEEEEDVDEGEEADTANSYAKKNKYKWLFEKELNRYSDLSCRLLLGKQLVSKKIIPHLDAVSAKAIQTRTGLEIDVWDVDTETQHQLVLSKWYTDYYSIDCYWRGDFVERRDLKIKDEIKFGVDRFNSRFCFSVVRRSQD